MVGRYRDSKGINYPFTEEISHLGKNLELKIDFDSIIEKGYDIIVLNHQPGIGKTTSITNYIMDKCSNDEKFSFYYFTDRHKTIDEHLERLNKIDKNIVNTFEHWKGFGKYCNHEIVDNLIELNLPHNIIMQNLNLDEHYKEYLQQFNNTKRVFAPFFYLASDYFKNSLPDIVFVDERITQIETYFFDKQYLIEGLEQLDAPKSYIENANKWNLNFFQDKNVLKKIESLYYNKIIKAIKRGTKNFERYKKLNPYRFKEFLKWGKIYNYQFEHYSLPLFYKALDVLLLNIPLILLDATFNREIFSYFLESYNGEIKKLKKDEFLGFNNLKIKILGSSASSQDTKVYRMKPGGAWSKRSFIEYSDTTWKWLLADLHELRKIFGDANIGIISFKELSWLFESMNFDVEYYGSLRGTNRLENKKVLVIIGTWLPLPPSWEDENFDKEKDYIDKLVEKFFLIRIKEEDLIEAKIGAPLETELEHPLLFSDIDSKSRISAFIDAKLNPKDDSKKMDAITELFIIRDAERVLKFPICAINTIWFDEIYQAFHRNRGLRYPRIIFCYGWFPEAKMMMKFDKTWTPEEFIKYNLRKEFPSTSKVMEGKIPIETIDDKDKEEIFNYYRIRNKGGIMQDLMKKIELNEKSYDIAGKFSINIKGNIRRRDTKSITELKKAYKNLKDIVPHRKN